MISAADVQRGGFDGLRAYANEHSDGHALSDLTSLLQILNDLPPDTKSYQTIASQIVLLTFPTQDMLDQIKAVNSILARRLHVIGASSAAAERFGGIFPLLCADQLN